MHCSLQALIEPKGRISVFDQFYFTLKQSVYIIELEPTVIPRHHSVIIINRFLGFAGFIDLLYKLLQFIGGDIINDNLCIIYGIIISIYTIPIAISTTSATITTSAEIMKP